MKLGVVMFAIAQNEDFSQYQKTQVDFVERFKNPLFVWLEFLYGLKNPQKLIFVLLSWVRTNSPPSARHRDDLKYIKIWVTLPRRLVFWMVLQVLTNDIRVMSRT